METMLSDTSVGRCHRSYLVNFGRVKVMRREKDGLYLELDAQGVMDIPVSKTFQDKVGEKFVTHSFKN
jgi:DNA-binding LytR/AlgR family response regulator